MIELIQGSDETVQLEFFEGEETGPVLDLTGFTVSIASGSDISPTPTVTNAAQGRLNLFFDDALSASLSKGRTYRFRIAFDDPLSSSNDWKTPDFSVMFT